MTAESELIQKRQEVKGEILALKETILSARIFNQLGRAFKPNSFGYWLSVFVLLNLIVIVPTLLVGLAFKEITKLSSVFVYGLVATEVVVFALVIAHVAVCLIFDDIANQIIEKINNVDDLSKLLLWFKQTWSMQNVSVIANSFCLIWVISGVGALSFFIHQFVGFGFLVWCVLNGLLAGVLMYILLWASLLAFNLKEYQYEMNTFSPADSEIINDISEMLMRSIYVLAVAAAIITLVITSSLFDQQIRITFSVPMLVICWAIIASQFFLTRSTLGAITNRAKWIPLNRIQKKINALEAAGDLSDKDTAERLFRLADIHKQIMASKTNTLDLKSVSTLFSQLMLPLLGLLLGNLDKVLKLLSK